ncbi:adenylate/guanylate cyclase domain-containing protein [Shimia abyssi]|uniref:SAM (Sterile alpha motif) domain-containing protein n=1 Tax=Shimia abyssi TaxID=1662395 RepID=A0A2P8F8V0_9RHOB|nr:adenylate/guanylate cyclase domain-containing protein [Shimia abyssi]PSL18161.1 SAM (Sterile alpha motif) domain-containing protein [Shimia abyssi]
MALNIDAWLFELGLDQYTDSFINNDVDDRVLPLLTGDDLKELGVSLGHRKIILAAIKDPQNSLASFSTPELAPSLNEQTLQSEPSQFSGHSAPDTVVSSKPNANTLAERRHLTVLFADLVGSTKLTNRLDPEDMRILLQRYQDAVAGAVSRYGGYVAKYLGDGLLVFFGWPSAYEDHAVRAVKAGLDAVDRVKELETPDGEPLAVRMGVASGEVVVGDAIGENTYEEGAMTGPILNLAARIQEYAPPNTIVLPEEETEAALRRIFEFSSLGQVELKGFDSQRTLLQVVAEHSAQSRFRAAHREDSNSALVGRNLENGILRQAWKGAKNGKGEVVLLAGEAGIGKSRLTEEFLADDAIASNADIIRLNCSPYLTSSPFHPVTERISQDAGVEPGFDDDRVLEQVQAMLETRQGLDIDQVLPVFAALVAPRSKIAQQILDLSPQEQRDLTIQTLIDTVKARANVRPVILFIEDAHWIDPSTNALLDRFKAICADLPLMLLITHRPGWELDQDDGDAHVQTLQLRRFDFDHVANLVRSISGSEPDRDLVQTVVERTDGIPLFVEELTRAIVTSGEKGKFKVPSSLKGTLMARLDAVSLEAKQVALAGSVIGREFEPALLRATMDKGEAEIRNCLDDLCKSGLIFESGHNRGYFVFRHALIRDTAFQSMLASTRRELHAKVAGALTLLRSAEIERRPELVAHHLTAAEDWAAAFQRWQSATEMALARSASHEAMANAKEALKAAHKLGDESSREVIVGKILVGRGYDSVGRLPEGIATLKEASEAAREIGDVEIAADAAHHFADSSMMAGELHEQAIKVCLKALNELPDHDEVRRCKLMSQLARTYMFTGQFAASAEYSQQCLKLAAKLGDLKSQFHVMMARFAASFVARQEDEVRDWRKNLEAMHKVAEKLGTIDQGRDRTLSLFVGAEMADRQLMDNSLELLTEISTKENHRQLYWVQTHARAMVATLEGDFERAESYANEAVKIGRQTHGKHVEGVYGVQMFTIRREQGRLQEVAPVIKRLMTERSGDASWKPGFGVIAAELGYIEPAERILNELAETGFSISPDAMYSTTLSYLADICVAVENEIHAKTIFDMLAPYESLTITAGATTACIGAAARRLGSLAALMGNWETSDKMFDKAIKIDTIMAAPPWIAHSKAAYAFALRRRGRVKDAERAIHLEAEALATARDLGMVSLISKLEGQVT